MRPQKRARCPTGRSLSGQFGPKHTACRQSAIFPRAWFSRALKIKRFSCSRQVVYNLEDFSPGLPQGVFPLPFPVFPNSPLPSAEVTQDVAEVPAAAVLCSGEGTDL